MKPDPQPNVMFSSEGYVVFQIVVTDRSDYTISGRVEKITAWEGTEAPHTPCEAELYLTFYMKWDGCCHVTFGEYQTKEDGKTPDGQDGYLHLCGAHEWAEHLMLMKGLYEWAERTIPMQKDTSGDLPKSLMEVSS